MEGGWGLKNIYHFGQARAAKILWRLLFDVGLWNFIMKRKYFKFFLCSAMNKIQTKNFETGIKYIESPYSILPSFGSIDCMEDGEWCIHNSRGRLMDQKFKNISLVLK